MCLGTLGSSRVVGWSWSCLLSSFAPTPWWWLWGSNCGGGKCCAGIYSRLKWDVSLGRFSFDLMVLREKVML